MPSTGTLTNEASEPAVNKVNNDISLNKTNASADDKDSSHQADTIETDMERDSETEIESGEKSSPTFVQQFGILRQYQHKASKLLDKITQHPDGLTLNDAGEMVFGKAEPGMISITCLKVCFGALDLNQPGIEMFLTPIKALVVRSNELSGKALHMKYSPPVPRGSSQHQLAALKAEPSSIKMAEPLEKYVTPKHSS